MSTITLDNCQANIKFLEKLELVPDVKDSFFKPFSNNHVRCLAHVFHLAARAMISAFEDLPEDENVPIESFLEKENKRGEVVTEKFVRFIEELPLKEEKPAEDQKTKKKPKILPISRLRKFLHSIRMSSTKKVTLFGLQREYKIPESLPVMDVSTHWNSTYFMLEWAIDNKRPINDLMKNDHFKFPYGRQLR